MKSRILFGAAVLALSTAAFAAGKPQLGDFGYDATGMDKAVAPGDDFYKFANGKWDEATAIPADKSSWGGFAILRNLSDIFMFGRYFHETFMAPALERCRAVPAPLPPLSVREQECLRLAANGLTTRDISHKLDISSRTVQFHFENICSKLHASNRQEAVARGVQTGIVRAG